MLEWLQSVGRRLPRGGSSPCHVNIHFPEYGMPGSRGGGGGLRVPVWQAYLTLSHTPMVRLGFNTWLLQKHWTENSWKGQRPGKERHGWIPRPEAQKVPAAVTSPYHQVAVQVSMRGQSTWGPVRSLLPVSPSSTHTRKGQAQLPILEL